MKAASWLVYVLLFLVVSFSCQGRKLKNVDFIIKNRKVYAEIILDKNAVPATRIAANELASYLFKISGCKVVISTSLNPKYPVKIFVGTSDLQQKITGEKLKFDDEEFQIKSGDNWLLLAGNDTRFEAGNLFPNSRGEVKQCADLFTKKLGFACDFPFKGIFKQYNKTLDLWEFDQTGSLYAVDQYLKSLGVRWYLPGNEGEVIPEFKSIAFKGLDIKRKPSFPLRYQYIGFRRFGMASYEDLMWHLRLGINAGQSHFSQGPPGHGLKYMLDAKENYKLTPDMYALYNGKRNPKFPCLSSTELITKTQKLLDVLFTDYYQTAMSVMPPDGYGKTCECSKCKKFYSTNGLAESEQSDYVWNFVNTVAKASKRKHPQKSITCFSYAFYKEVPKKIGKLENNIQVGICRIRANNTNSSNTLEDRNLINSWFDYLENRKLIFWDYYIHSKERNTYYGYPLLLTKQIKSDFEEYWRYIDGEFIEVWREQFSNKNEVNLTDLATNFLNIYLTAEYLFNEDVKLDWELNYFYTNFYKDAADKMEQFFNYAESNWSKGSNQDLNKYKELLTEAKKKTRDPLVLKRIGWIETYLQPLESINKLKQIEEENGSLLEIRLVNKGVADLCKLSLEEISQKIPARQYFVENKNGKLSSNKNSLISFNHSAGKLQVRIDDQHVSTGNEIEKYDYIISFRNLDGLTFNFTFSQDRLLNTPAGVDESAVTFSEINDKEGYKSSCLTFDLRSKQLTAIFPTVPRKERPILVNIYKLNKNHLIKDNEVEIQLLDGEMSLNNYIKLYIK